MPLFKLQLKPGINREQSNLTNEGGWYDSDKVRFRDGFPEKIGGWTKIITAAFIGVSRLLFAWLTLAGDALMAIGTHKKFYIEYGGVFIDITPVAVSVTAANPIATVNTSTTITISTGGPAHGASIGDYVVVSGSTAVGGVPAAEINAEHVIVTVPSSTSVTVTVATAATSTVAAGGGAAVTMQFLYPNGQDVTAFGTGWGAGAWSRGSWGSAADIGVPGAQLRTWSADNNGEDLLFCPRNGPLFFWDVSGGFTTANRGIYVNTIGGASNVPATLYTVLVTSERYAVAFGCAPLGSSVLDPLLIRWSNQEDYTNWTPTTTNTSGDLRIPSGSYITTALKARTEILVFTDTSLHSFQHLGPPFVFGQQTLAENVSIISPNAAIAINNVVYWMGRDQFYLYNGQVKTIPCSVQQYVFSNIDTTQGFQVYCGSNESFGEVTWFYCINGSSLMTNYVTYNYIDNIWYYGTMDRTSWKNAPSKGSFPYATQGGYGSTNGYLYIHDYLADDVSTSPATAISSYIKSADIDIGDGENFMFVDKVVPDFDFEGSTAASPALDVILSTRNTSGGNYLDTGTKTVTRTATSPVTQYTQQLWMRLRGRQLQVQVSSTTTGVKWRLGTLRVNAREDGKR